MDKHTLMVFILGFSVMVQLFAAVMAFRLINITGRRMAWIFISSALAFMALRRAMPLYYLLKHEFAMTSDLIAELVGLGLSLLMAIGVVLIAPLFLERRRVEVALEEKVNNRVAELVDLNRDLQQQVFERKAVEHALSESKKRFMDVFYASHDAMLLISGNKFVDCNEATARMLGYAKRDEFLMTHPSELSPPVQLDGRPSFEKANEMMSLANVQGFHRFEWAHRKANGEVFPVEVSLTPIVIHGKNVIHCVWRDLSEIKRAHQAVQQEASERQKAEEGIRAAKERAEQLMFLVPSAVFTVDLEGRITSWNRAMEKITGYAKEEVMGKTCYSFALEPCTQRCGLYASDVSKPIIGRECSIRTKTGDVRTISKNAQLLYDADAHVVGGIESFEDITARKCAEEELRKAYVDLKSTQEQLLQSEKMATVGQLAAGVAHEINNPASFVMNNLDVLKHYIDSVQKMLVKYAEMEECLKESDIERAMRALAEIKQLRHERGVDFIMDDLSNITQESLDGMRRIQRIVGDLKSFSHSDEGCWQEADVHDLIQSALNIAVNEIKYKVEVVTEYGAVPWIRCYPQQLSQVFLNLLVNAVQAIPEKGRITIRTFADADMVVVEFVDNGIGMTDDVRRHVFEPFFTTKPVGKGTGLGLSLSYNIIKKHNGEIAVASRPGEGSVFTIRLPKGVSHG